VDDAPEAVVDEAARLRLAEARADELRAVYHTRATERLRLRLVAELARLHEERLHQHDPTGARRLLDEIRTMVFHHGAPTRLVPTPSLLVQEQGLHLAQALVGSVRAAVLGGRHTEAESLFSDLARARRFAPEHPAMDDAWCEGLAWAHRCALDGRRWVVAWGRLDDLRSVARGDRVRRRDALTLALADAHADARRHGRLEAADRLLHELRGIASRAMASTFQRASLCRALRQAHGHAGPGRRSALLTELSHWANRPTATEEMRREHARAAAAQRRDAGDSELPLGVLRARAYRSDAKTTDAEALFVRLETTLDEDSHAWAQWSMYLSELRELAARPDAPPRLRLRFCRRWLAHRCDPRQPAAAECDRACFVWAQAAARRGERDGQLLLGHCYREGRGVEASDRRATDCYRQAAAAGSSEAQFWLRYTAKPRLGGWFAGRGVWVPLIGFSLLFAYAVTAGGSVPSVLGIALYLVLQLSLQLAIRLAAHGVTGADGDTDAWSSQQLVQWLRARPWRLALVAAEDGLLLVPLSWLGINPWTALLAGVAFGWLHHPSFGWRMCVAKGVTYFVATLTLLPAFGLWTLVLGHVVFDALVVVLSRILRP
jgi:TPR repeat protein